MDRLGQYWKSKVKTVCLRDMILSLSLSVYVGTFLFANVPCPPSTGDNLEIPIILFDSIKSAHQMAINCVNPKPDPHDPERRDVLAHEHPYLTLPPRNLALFQHPFHFHNSRPEPLSLSLTLSSVDHHSPVCTRAAASRVSSNSEKYHMLSGQGSNFRDIAIRTTLAP